MSRGYSVLAEKPERDPDLDVMFDMFLREAYDFPSIDGELVTYAVERLYGEALIDQVQTQSASGLLNLNTFFGSPVGSKEEMHHGAVAVNRQDLEGTHVPPALPYKPAGKGEVIKKGKKVRTIQLESQANYQVLKHFFEHQVSSWIDPAGGIAIGMSTRNGDYKQIIISWYDVVRQHLDLDWDEFLDWLAEQPLHESDKSAWEASTNALDGFNFVMSTLARCDVPVAGREAEVLARAVADYINPPILVDRDVVYSVPWRVASGSYFTAFGNSRRHKRMVDWVCDFLEVHGMAYGKEHCTCAVCGSMGGTVGWGAEVSRLEVDLLRRAFVLGDDFIAVNYHPYLFDKLLDSVFGTSTNTEVKSFFSGPSLVEPGGVEFLRRHFVRIDNNVFTFRAPGRALAKLFKGTATRSRERFYAACLSALFDCGANRELYKIIFDLLHVEHLDEKSLREELEEYVRRHPGIESLSDGFIPTYHDLLVLDSSVLQPLYRYVASRVSSAYGMTPRQLELEAEPAVPQLPSV